MKTFAAFYSVISIIHAKIIDLASSDNVTWNFTNSNNSVTGKATVPGGVYTDLQDAGIITDVLLRYNDVTTRWVALETWTYMTTFNVSSEDLMARVIHLVFEGLDTIAFIELNDHIPIGSTNNMFVRYVYDVKDKLRVGENELKVTFLSPVTTAERRYNKTGTFTSCMKELTNGECYVNQIRKMQASFGSDWGPAFPSVGIWKPVYIELYNGAIIRSVTTNIEDLGSHWNLKIKAYLETSQKKTNISAVLRATLKVEDENLLNEKIHVNKTTEKDGKLVVNISMNVSEDMVRVWWPNGYGDQPLYSLYVILTPDDYKNESAHKFLRIGFRTIQLVESDARRIFGKTTAGEGLTFYFKVNGYPIFMKGANWVPLHILPELNEGLPDVVENLLLAAREVHMSMLRVWGGGFYESDYFYKKCDELGILIWQDFPFSSAMYPADMEFIVSIHDEIEQNVLRLQHHPSLAVWAGNHENEALLSSYEVLSSYPKYSKDYIKLYVYAIKSIVEDVDPGRRYLVSTPSNGLQSEKDGYIADDPYDSNYGDTHYYNYLYDNWEFSIYPKTRFASEYGFQSLPSLKTMRTATKNPDDFSVHSEFSKHRQHILNGYAYIKNQILARMKLDEDDPKYFEKFVFYSQISQAMAVKTETEMYRQDRAHWYTMGALYWQLNDAWQAPSLSGIENGGKWKMLHYFAKTFFAPVLVSPRLQPSGNITLYLINDKLTGIMDARIILDIYNWTSQTPILTKEYPGEVRELHAKIQSVEINLNQYNKEEIFLKFSLNATDVTSPSNYVFPVPLKSIVGLKQPKIQIKVGNFIMTQYYQNQVYTVSIEVDTVVLFLWLETKIDGRFEENGLVITEPKTFVKFFSSEHVTPGLLQSSIKCHYYIN